MIDRRVFIAGAGAATLALTLRRRRPGVDLGPVRHAWCGAVTPTSCRIVAATRQPEPAVRWWLARNPDFSDAIPGEPTETRAEEGCLLSFAPANLEPRTTYHYGLEVGEQFVRTGSFRTFPAGPADFQVAFASCARTGSNSPVFEAIARHDPDLFVHMGDFHYENIATEAPAARRAAYARVLESPAQSFLYRHFPTAYMWDDHDYLGDNTDGVANTPARQRARADARRTYQQCVPHYPLAAGAGDVPIGQAFSLGRARFLLTDNRSEKIPGQTMLGEAQKKWFKEEIRSAKASHPLFVWVNSVPWIAPAEPIADLWGGFDAERRELADFFKAEGLAGRICILSGDAHMLAIDDGRNADYATGGGLPIPVFQAAPLDQRPSFKGGPYTHGPSLLSGQFGLMQVTDDGRDLRVRWKGMTLNDRPARGIEHEFVVRG